jgi:hypothetical protein
MQTRFSAHYTHSFTYMSIYFGKSLCLIEFYIWQKLRNVYLLYCVFDGTVQAVKTI